MKKPSEFGKFEKWFEAQFGKRPSKFPVHELKEKSRSAHSFYANICRELHKAEEWDELYNACRYAWNAKKGK